LLNELDIWHSTLLSSIIYAKGNSLQDHEEKIYPLEFSIQPIISLVAIGRLISVKHRIRHRAY